LELKFNFVKKQGNRWIDSAIDARFTYKAEHHYLIEKDAKGNWGKWSKPEATALFVTLDYDKNKIVI
jgi:hypothetical protein